MAVNIWSWVFQKVQELEEKEELQLAAAMNGLGSWVEGKNAAAIVGPAVVRAQELGETWVEVFLRHWHLQNLIFYDTDLRKALPEAASLIEFATRPENRDCPQSVCAVEDLVCALGMKEGHAYAQERIEIIQDTMAHLEPERACCSCMLDVLCDAYLDAGGRDRFEAIFFEKGDPRLHTSYHLIGAKLALAKGDKVLCEQHIARIAADWEIRRIQVRQLRAELCLMEGRFEDALTSLGDWDLILKTVSTIQKSCAIAVAALEGGGDSITDRALWIDRLDHAIRYMAAVGISYPALDLAVRTAPLLAVHGVQSALALLDTVAPELAELKEPERIRPRLEAVRQALLAA